MAGNSVTIPGTKMINCRIVNLNLQAVNNKRDSNYTLLLGMVVSPKGDPLPNSAVQVFRIDNSVVPAVKEAIGVTFADENGRYGVSLLSNGIYSYELIPYTTVTNK